MRITLKQLEVFVAVAQSGSVTRAAGELTLTQSATSMALADFETQLNRKLFDRIGKRVLLNDYGRLLLPKAIDAIARLQEIESLAVDSGPRVGNLRIGASSTIGNYLLPGLIGEFLRGFPEARIALDVGNTGQVIESIRHFHADVGFIEGYCHDPEVEVLPWWQDELVVFAAREHLLALQEAITLADLAAAEWVLREPASGTREVLDNALLGKIPRLHLRLELGNTEAIKRAVQAGVGIGCVSRLALADAFREGSLVELATPFLDLRRHFYILIHSQKYRTDGINRFLAHCQRQSDD